MKKANRLGLILLTLCCVISALPVSAAEKTTFSKVIIVKASEQSRVLSGKWTGSVSASREKPFAVITVESGFKGQLTLDGLTVDATKNGGDYACALYIEPGAYPKIILKGKNTLISGNYRAGLEVPVKATALVWGSGRLAATGGANAAGIGGANGKNCGKLYVGAIANKPDNFPTIIANGGTDAAGIGGGSRGNGGIVEVAKGLVIATGNGKAQDVGYGAGGSAGKVTITGGRLSRFRNIGWSEADSKPRMEVKVVLADNGDADRLKGVEIIASGISYYTNLSTVPLPDGGAEEDTAYVYLPEKTKFVTVKYVVTDSGKTSSSFGPTTFITDYTSEYISTGVDVSEGKAIIVETPRVG